MNRDGDFWAAIAQYDLEDEAGDSDEQCDNPDNAHVLG